MKIALIDERMPRQMQDALCMHGIVPFSVPPSSQLSAPVASHPDMLFFPCGGNLFLHLLYYREHASTLDSLFARISLRPIFCEGDWSATYPHDVRFNAVDMGGRLFCRHASIQPEIALAFSRVCNVAQGYAGCSVCTVGENALITADSGIAKAALACGIDVLQIQPGFVSLPGYSYGFIGGASGYSADIVFFCGNPLYHPDGEAILTFCRLHQTHVVSLMDAPLADYGKILIL